MTFITDKMYAEIASRFFQAFEPDENYFNGKVEYDTEAFYSTLTCSAIIYRASAIPDQPQQSEIEKVIPVWWEFSACAEGQPVDNDFSWSEFSAFFPLYG